jgi:putative transposase
MELKNPDLSLSRQCELLGMSRSSFYYRAREENGYNEFLMRLIDEQFTRRPTFGVEKMRDWLRNQGYWVNTKRVRRLMRLMGLYAVYPKPRISKSCPEHKVYPYLLRGLRIDRPDQVWASDITYIRLLHGFVYLTVIMDWFSRYVLYWKLSITLEKEFCLDALRDALIVSTPEIFNSDQGSQFTSEEFTGILKDAEVRISMDGRGRLYDNIFVERLWRTVKYDEVYLHDYISVPMAKNGLGNYFEFYNTERPHSSLDGRTPHDIYFGIETVREAGFGQRL